MTNYHQDEMDQPIDEEQVIRDAFEHAMERDSEMGIGQQCLISENDLKQLDLAKERARAEGKPLFVSERA